jgi:hypothetical protein
LPGGAISLSDGGNTMRAGQPGWQPVAGRIRRARWRLGDDLFAITVLCVIFGLEIIAVMQTAGGPDAYRAIAAEGVQVP